jgi:hypothetical protein
MDKIQKILLYSLFSFVIFTIIVYLIIVKVSDYFKKTVKESKTYKFFSNILIFSFVLLLLLIILNIVYFVYNKYFK